MSARRAGWALGALLLGGLVGSAASARAEPSQDSQSEARFQFVVPAQLELTMEELAELPMRLQPAAGYRASPKGPLRIDLTPAAEAGIKVKKRHLSLRDATNPSSAAPVFLGQVSAAKAGSYELAVSLYFWLCRGKLCRPQHAAATIQLEVSEARPPELPDAGIPSALRTAPN